jgi:hypothetical protein
MNRLEVKMMERNSIRKSEVLSFLEWKIINNVATNEEEQLYIDFKWNGEIEKNDTYKQIIKQYKELHNEKF